MLVVMRNDATPEEIEGVRSVINDMGFRAEAIPGRNRSVVGIVGNEGAVDGSRFTGMPGVKEVVPITRPFKMVSREWHADDSIVEVGLGVSFGGAEIPVIAGPCSVESEQQIMESARVIRECGGSVLRGGAFKPRSSPYSFQGLGIDGLKLLASARDAFGLPVVTEAIDPDTVEQVAEYADVIQIGSRNMQNFPLLRRAGRSGRPVLLKRGMASTITELLLSAEYVLAEGNPNVILCERGIRGFDPNTRNVLDLAAIPAIKSLTHLPVVADPSHGTGVRALVPPMARAAVAAGADGVMLEVHPDPAAALSDGAQSVPLADFHDLMAELAAVAGAVGRSILGARETAGA